MSGQIAAGGPLTRLAFDTENHNSISSCISRASYQRPQHPRKPSIPSCGRRSQSLYGSSRQELYEPGKRVAARLFMRRSIRPSSLQGACDCTSIKRGLAVKMAKYLERAGQFVAITISSTTASRYCGFLDQSWRTSRGRRDSQLVAGGRGVRYSDFYVGRR